MTREEILKTIKKTNDEKFSGKQSLSVSKLISLCHKEFEKERIAQELYEKHFDDNRSKYFQKTSEEIIEIWDAKSAEACRYGSLLDEYAEACLEGKENAREVWKLDHNIGGDDKRLNVIADGMDQFLSSMMKSEKFEYVGREIPVWLEYKDKAVNGRLDCL